LPRAEWFLGYFGNSYGILAGLEGLVDMSTDEDDRARLRLKMRVTVGITFAAGLGVPSRTTKQAACSSTDHGGGKRRCAVGI
jgi:hypothetical protein